MDRYVFFGSSVSDAKALAAAKKSVKAQGAVVVRALAGTMLIEADPTQLRRVAEALPDWRYSPERKTARVPERTPLQRAKMRMDKD